MRKRSLDMVHALARRDERVVFIGSDLSPNLLGEMKKEYPSRYYMEGITEANVIGMAAGMAMDGFIPYVNTIATFITRRCYEQVAVDLCLHDLPVRLIGNGGGYVYAPLGPTHQAIEDIAIMRALPHMTVTAVCDAEEMTRLMNASLDWPHPIYIRLGKGGDPVISKPERGFAIGKAIDMIEAEQGASDVLFVTTGVGNGSTYRMIPSIFREEKLREAKGLGETARALALQAASIEGAAALGFIGAVGACGGYLIPRGFGASIAATGGPHLALAIYLAFYGSCLALTWWYYLRKSFLATSAPNLAEARV